MSEEQEKEEKVTNPAPLPRSFRLPVEDIEILRWLSRRWGASGATVIRKLLREAARKEGMPDREQ